MAEINAKWQELARSAAEYCRLIEQVDKAGSSWLEALARLLPRIHAAVLALEEMVDTQQACTLSADYERRFALYSRLRRLLGERDHYRMVFDSGQVDALVSGSLADDITDIYFELKGGLDILRRDPEHPAKAASTWRHGFIVHWGQHLVDAERHLYELKVNNQLSRHWRVAG